MTAVDPVIEARFQALPLRDLADAALHTALKLGADEAAVRIERIRTAHTVLYDARPRGSDDLVDLALGVQVSCRGTAGFGSVAELTTAGAARAAEYAVAMAGAGSRAGSAFPPADERPAGHAVWSSPCERDPFAVPAAEVVGLLDTWSTRLLAHPVVAHVMAKVTVARENKYYADTNGSSIVQQRTRIHPQVVAVGERSSGGAASMRTVGPPTARGWEYVCGQGWDWNAELAGLPELLAGKLAARPVQPGSYDLVLAPSHLWLTIHESVGHATEMDRMLGSETSYAGGSFVRPGDVGSLLYGSALMTVTADRTSAYGLASAGYDDEGVAAQDWTLVDRGVLVGAQTDRRTAARARADRSTGCAYAESARHEAISRMPNVSLQPDPAGPDETALIAGVENGLYLTGSDSWSIDSQRRSFQFTAQACHLIRNGRLAGQVDGAAYQSDTLTFWRSLVAVGNSSTYGTFGADLCGKGQPVQAAAVSHGAPAAVFTGVRVVDAERDVPR
ncbi:TldD/PmbA family protein [Winogradskya humida]|uniref:Peptidase U62, modulator of DNA gyrase n=1 Tax=Winogradskya humida TaxID=113566 RepID=A0ABQ4A863_9ACTN|nr:TldD/PmbA family protein [Actinoplanes humidus]GIE26828.1 peptidase U62, modulator of DNA gyrase [Actinoplanes humidus]